MEHFDTGSRLLNQRPLSLVCLEEAIAEYDKAILLEPQLARAYHKRGWAYTNLGRCARAIKDYDEAFRLDPKLAEAYADRGLSYWAIGGNLANDPSGHYERAIQDYDESIRVSPQSGIAYEHRAMANTVLSKDVKSQQDVDRAVELGINRGYLETRIEEVKKQR